MDATCKTTCGDATCKTCGDATCKTCGTKFHACGSCDLWSYEWDYCNEECWKKSARFNEVMAILGPLPKPVLEKLVDDLEEWEIESVGSELLKRC